LSWLQVRNTGVDASFCNRHPVFANGLCKTLSCLTGTNTDLSS
jgi:hypothetical protein